MNKALRRIIIVLLIIIYLIFVSCFCILFFSPVSSSAFMKDHVAVSAGDAFAPEIRAYSLSFVSPFDDNQKKLPLQGDYITYSYSYEDRIYTMIGKVSKVEAEGITVSESNSTGVRKVIDSADVKGKVTFTANALSPVIRCLFTTSGQIVFLLMSAAAAGSLIHFFIRFRNLQKKEETQWIGEDASDYPSL